MSNNCGSVGDAVVASHGLSYYSILQLLRVRRARATWALDAHDDGQGSGAVLSLTDILLRGRKVAQRPLWQEMDTTTAGASRSVATVMKGRGQVPVELQRHFGDDLRETRVRPPSTPFSTYSRRAYSLGPTLRNGR